MNKQQHQEQQRHYMRNWYKNNKDWYVNYRKTHEDLVREAYQRYRKSPKGQKAIKRYESSPERKAAKAYWNFVKNLETRVEDGLMTFEEMNKRIRERKLVESGKMTMKEMMERIKKRRRLEKRTRLRR